MVNWKKVLENTRLTKRDFISLSLFRIAFSLYLLFRWLGQKLEEYDSFYRDSGVLPLSLLHKLFDAEPGSWSFLWISDSVWVHITLIGVAILSIIAFGVGLRTRIANAALLICVLLLYWRDPAVNSSRDTLIYLLLIWSLFLPLGRYWSMDAALNDEPRDRYYPLIPFLAMRLQIASVYFFSGIFKLTNEFWMSGKAVHISLLTTGYVTPAGLWLAANVPNMVYASCYVVIFAQLSFTVLVYSPLRNNLTRALALGVAVLMHVSFYVFLGLISYPLLCLCYLIILVPDEWWRACFKYRSAAYENMTIHYSGPYRKKALLLREFSLPLSVRVTESQATANIAITWGDERTPLEGRDAVRYILKQSPVLFLLGYLTRLSAIRTPKTTRMLRSRSDVPGKSLIAFCAMLALLAFGANIINTTLSLSVNGNEKQWPANVQSQVLKKWIRLAQILKVNQSWALFIVASDRQQSHMRLIAHMPDGKKVDYSNNFPREIFQWSEDGQSETRPLWGNYLFYISHSHSDIHKEFSAYLCRILEQEAPSPRQKPDFIELSIYQLPVDIQWNADGFEPDIGFRYSCRDGQLSSMVYK